MTSYQDMATSIAQSLGVDASVFTRQIQQESGFDPNAKSPAGAEGIAQFMPDTAQSMGVNPWDPQSALTGAARLDKQNLAKYGGDWSKALAAYNAGGGAVDSAVQNYGANWLAHMPAETQQYVSTIMQGQNVNNSNSSNSSGGGALLQPIFDSLRSWGIHIGLVAFALMLVIIGFWILTEKPQESTSTLTENLS